VNEIEKDRDDNDDKKSDNPQQEKEYTQQVILAQVPTLVGLLYYLI
jgi:hypothetical protein